MARRPLRGLDKIQPSSDSVEEGGRSSDNEVVDGLRQHPRIRRERVVVHEIVEGYDRDPAVWMSIPYILACRLLCLFEFGARHAGTHIQDEHN